MNNKDAVLSVRLSSEMYKKLLLHSKKDNRPKSSIVKEALEFYLQHKDAGNFNLTNPAIKELQEKYYRVVNRIDIISKQIDHLMKKNG